MLQEKVLQTIKEQHLIERGDRILLGLSGGGDSVALLFVLRKLQERVPFDLFACHVHHHIRQKTADEDALFSKTLSEKLGIPFILKEVQVGEYQKERGLSLEEAARILRYEALEEAAREQGIQKIALAHHEDDQVETVLFQLMRGSGLKGLSGMQYIREGRYIRPFLNCRRKEIEEYLQENRLDYRTDESNLSDDYSRNAIRHILLPEMEKIRPHSLEKIAETALYLGEVDRYLVQEAREVLEKEEDPEELSFGKMEKLDPVLKEYVLREFLRKNRVPLKDIGKIQIDDMLELFQARVGKRWFNKKGIALERTYTGVRLALEEEKPVPLEKNWCMTEEIIPYEGQIIPEEVYTKWIDCDKIVGKISLRTRLSKDVISTAPGTHKKLKDYLIDEKIPQKKRDSLPLVADEKEVIWVVGHRLSARYKITEDTKKVMIIKVREV